MTDTDTLKLGLVQFANIDNTDFCYRQIFFTNNI
jgi:hypothetical protein